MILADAVAVAFRSDAQTLIVRGVDTVLRLRPSMRGSAVTASACTAVVTDADGNTVTTGAVVIAAGVCSLTVPGTSTADLAAGDGWRVTWTVTLPGESTARTVAIAASLVLRHLYPVIDDQDIYDRNSALDPARNDCITQFANYEKQRADAWQMLMSRLVAGRRRPWLILTPEDLREAHLQLTFTLVFDDLKSRLNSAYAEQAKDYRIDYERAWSQIRMLEETPTPSGALIGSGDRKGTHRPIFLGGR